VFGPEYTTFAVVFSVFAYGLSSSFVHANSSTLTSLGGGNVPVCACIRRAVKLDDQPWTSATSRVQLATPTRDGRPFTCTHDETSATTGTETKISDVRSPAYASKAVVCVWAGEGINR